MKKVKVIERGNLPRFFDGDIENKENYVGEIRKENHSSYLLYNKGWDGHDGDMGDFTDEHYWWVAKERCEYLVDGEPNVEKPHCSCGDLLNKTAKDRVTGMVGIITAHCVWLTGPHRVYLEGIDNTGRPIGEWFDEERIQIL